MDIVSESPEYRIYSRKNFARLNEVGRYASFTCSKKWGDVDTWELVIPYDEFKAKWELPNPISLVGYTYGITVYRAGVYLIAGPITDAHREKTGDDDLLTLTGASDTFWLSTRYVWPNPTRPYNTYNADDELRYRWTEDGSTPCAGYTADPDQHAGLQMAVMVENNLCGDAWHGTIQGHTLDRRMAWDYGGATHHPTTDDISYDNGPVGPYFCRWETLLEACKKLSKIQATTVADECGFRLQNYGDGLMRFITSSPTDATGKAVFGTELGTIQSYDFTERRPSMNSVMVLGPSVADGENYPDADDSLTMYAHIETAQSAQSVEWYGLAEGIYDFSGTDSTLGIDDQHAQMLTDGQQQANEKSYDMEVKITLSESETVKFLSDYDIGYIVDVQLDEDSMYTDIIREINITVDAGGEVIEPIISSPTRFKRARPAETAAYNALKIALELSRSKR